jgi:hypothetical protein
VNHPAITTELIGAIQEERRLQAARRREISRRTVRSERPQQEIMRMALGPGIQFAGVTEHVLNAIGKDRFGHTTD